MDLRALLVTFPVVLALNAGGARGEDEIAAAEAAFREGRQLMKRGKYAEACLKFEASQALDPAAGTLLNLANCHEELGKTASAWAEFTKAPTSPRKPKTSSVRRWREGALTRSGPGSRACSSS